MQGKNFRSFWSLADLLVFALVIGLAVTMPAEPIVITGAIISGFVPAVVVTKVVTLRVLK